MELDEAQEEGHGQAQRWVQFLEQADLSRVGSSRGAPTPELTPECVARARVSGNFEKESYRVVLDDVGAVSPHLRIRWVYTINRFSVGLQQYRVLGRFQLADSVGACPQKQVHAPALPVICTNPTLGGPRIYREIVPPRELSRSPDKPTPLRTVGIKPCSEKASRTDRGTGVMNVQKRGQTSAAVSSTKLEHD